METIKCAYTELVDVDQLVEHPKNYNKHSERQIEMLAKIINYQGQRLPIVVSKRSGFIVAGHGRLMAIKKLGWKKAAVDYQHFENEAEEYAHMIADNKIAELAETDQVMLEDLVVELGEDFDQELLGLDEPLVVMDKSKEETEDDVPDAPPVPISKLGDLYELGEHRLLCGDSTDKATVERLMNGEKADMVFTDPPYGVSYKDSLGREIKNDKLTDQDLEDFVKEAFSCGIAVSTPDMPWFVWHASRFQREFENALNKNGIKVKQQIIWVKGEGREGTAEVAAPAIGRSHFRWLHEPCLYASAGSPYNLGDRKTTTVWTVTRQTTGTVHPTQKPIGLIEIALENASRSGQIVLDLFGGSGSTLIACEKTKRKCYMMELDPHYVDVIVSRWCKYTGKNKIKRNGEEITWDIGGQDAAN